jgi:hypothetical protein
LCTSYIDLKGNLIIELNKKQTWSNGKPVTIYQIIDSLKTELLRRKDIKSLLKIDLGNISVKCNSFAINSIRPDLLSILLRDPCWAPGKFISGAPSTGAFECIDAFNYKSLSIPSYLLNLETFCNTNDVIDAFNQKKLDLTSPADFTISKTAYLHKSFKPVNSDIYAYALLNPTRLGGLSQYNFRAKIWHYIAGSCDLTFLRPSLGWPVPSAYRKLSKSFPKLVTILYSDYWPNNLLASKITRILDELGIKSKLQSTDLGEFVKKVDAGDFDISIIITPGMLGDKWSLISLFASMIILGCGKNISSKIYESLMEKSRERDLCIPSEQLVELVAEHAPVVPFGEICSGILSSERVGNILPIEGGILPLELLNK